VTSLVRFAPGARFPFHAHPEGEEILVLEGEFADENGIYPAGTYLFNPDSSAHAPFSREGCLLLVKLRQYPGERERVVAEAAGLPWLPGRAPGITQQVLYRQPGLPELVRLVRLAPATEVPAHDHPEGEEVFVLEGAIADAHGHYGRHCWFHYPRGSRHRPWSETGCLLYVRSGGQTVLG
jgi:anti-sigma factor ChrR (cupin superfamily)